MDLTPFDALELGWSVVPVGPDKKPYLRWKPYQKTRPSAEILSTWQAKYNPEAWAVVTGEISGIILLDFDGEAGARTLESIGITPHVRTGSGGHHLYIKHPGCKVTTLNGKSKTELGRRFPGLDVRGDGGYAIFMGRNAKGEYTWLRAPVPDPVSALPRELAGYLGLIPDECGDHPDPASAESLLGRALEMAPGGRNDAGFWLACQLRDNRCTRAQAESVMHRYQQRAGEDNAKGVCEPYSWAEALASLDQAYSAPAREPLGTSTGSGSDREIRKQARPKPLKSRAYHGLVGEFIRLVGPHTESDPIALLSSFFVAFGNVIGRSAHFAVEAHKHYLNLYAVLVGVTSKARKGTSWNHIQQLFEAADPEWASRCILKGLSSGEGLIWAVRDPIEKPEPIRQGRRVIGYQHVVVDEGISDKRLLVTESEFANTLQVLGRDGNTLSCVMRDAWDTGKLRTMTKSSPARATGAHVSILGHITRDELLRYLHNTEAGNGFGNRFLWFHVARSKLLPEGGSLRAEDLEPIISRLCSAVAKARGVGVMVRDENARELWYEVYTELSEGKPGLLGSMIARAEAQVMRLACVYALLDESEIVRRVHLEAALEVWRYCEESARFIFGDSLGDPVADEVLRILSAAENGLTRTDINDHFKHNKSSSEITRALGSLLELQLVRYERDASGQGRPVERWFAIEDVSDAAATTYETNEIHAVSSDESSTAHCGDVSDECSELRQSPTTDPAGRLSETIRKETTN